MTGDDPNPVPVTGPAVIAAQPAQRHLTAVLADGTSGQAAQPGHDVSYECPHCHHPLTLRAHLDPAS